MPRLRGELAELFTLGTYDPTVRTGPTIWLKCIVDRTAPEAPTADDVVPILYLPGVSRQELRAGGDCRPDCQPLIELLFRGRPWHQENGKDWSVEAFLVSEEGLGLDVARDSLTRDAITRALAALATTPLEGLRGRRLDAHDFDHLMVPDPVRDVLRWLSDTTIFQNDLDPARWGTFCQLCRNAFGIDPHTDDPSLAATLLVEGRGRWDEVWQRFTESPRAFRGIAALLRQAELSTGKLPFDGARLPAQNERAEVELRAQLEAAARLPHREACAHILELEREHGPRRKWVWSELGESPLAQALSPLSRLASLAQRPSVGTSFESAITAYTTEGWRCDHAAIETLALPLGPAQSVLVARVVRSLYEPWLDATARSFQTHVSAHSPVWAGSPGVNLGQGETSFLFVDGLRFDIAGMLQEKLEGRELRVKLTARLAPVPTVTATAKPVACLAADIVTGLATTDDFTPVLAGNKQFATITRLRDEMSRRGINVMEGDDVHAPSAAHVLGWSECGRLDELGHKLGLGLARQIDQELEILVDRIVGLLDCGWTRVRVVTDHGWLLLPGGLPKVDLSPWLTATKWARCACVRGESQPSVPTYRWHWHADVRIACPPGIGSFFAGSEYAHGGISPQECVIPELTVERGSVAIRASIGDIQWRGMRLRVRVTPPSPGLRVDLRRNAKQEATSIVASVKELDHTGDASLVVADDKDEGAAAVIVVLDSAGTVLDRKATTVGENQ
jgi:hypothetical protein